MKRPGLPEFTWGASIALVMMLQASGGCASRTIPAVNQALIDRGQQQGSTAEQLRYGRKLLVTECAYCHVAIDPASISMERWDRVLPRMVNKAHLPATVVEDIRAYIMAARANGTPLSDES